MTFPSRGTVALLALTAATAACQPSRPTPLEAAAARCGAPVSSIYLARSSDGKRVFVRQAVAAGAWSDGTKACLRQWAVEAGYVFVDPAA